MYVSNRFLVASVLLFMSPAVRVSTTASESMLAPIVEQKVVPLMPFGSVELRNGGKVILHHGPTQSATLIKGSLDYTGVTIADGGHLVIDRCKSECPRGYDLEIDGHLSFASRQRQIHRGGEPG